MKIAGYLVLAVALGFGCNSKSSDPPPQVTAEKQPQPTAKKRKKITLEDMTRANRYIAAEAWGDESLKEGYVPAEFKSGKGRWRDATAYVDGQPIGMFWYGELPSTLEPVWVEVEEDLDWSRAKGGPMTRKVKTPRYRLAEYLAAAGVPLDKVKMVHIIGPHNSVVEVSGKKLAEFHDTLQFRFGSEDNGKPIPEIPSDLGKNFDRLMAVCVYIDKKPPEIDRAGHMFLNGKPVDGVPYFGEPIRGGIRIYKDDRLASRIKRNKMNRSLGTKLADGTTSYKLMPVLEELGVETKDIVQLEVIFDERRTVRYSREELETMTFRSIPQAKGQIQLNQEDIFAHALAFYTKPLPEKTAANRAQEQ